MQVFPDIPFPIAFSTFKHHKRQIIKTINYSDLPESQFQELVHSLGNNYIDIYTGLLTPLEISNSIIHILKSQNVLEKNNYISWLTKVSGYRFLQVTDQSWWIAREGKQGRYVHIHPVKKGQFTARYKASTLKTVYLLMRLHDQNASLQLDVINAIRGKIDLSPVKTLKPVKAGRWKQEDGRTHYAPSAVSNPEGS